MGKTSLGRKVGMGDKININVIIILFVFSIYFFMAVHYQ